MGVPRESGTRTLWRWGTGWAIEGGHSHCADTLVVHCRLGQGGSGVGHSGGHSRVGHSRDTLGSRDERGVDRARRRVPGEEKS